MPLRKLLLRVVFVSLALAAVLGAAGILLAGHDTIWRVVATAVATAGGALLMLSVTKLVDKPQSWAAGVLAIILIVIEFLVALSIIWELRYIGPLEAVFTM